MKTKVMICSIVILLVAFVGSVFGGMEGDHNTFYGYNAGANNTTGTWVTFIGALAGYANTTGDYNTFLGTFAGTANTTGYHNAFLGSYTGNSNTTGHNNTFIGVDAGLYNTTGNYNTFLGYAAGWANTTAYDNTFIGYYAGFANTTGQYNTFLGWKAGTANTTGNANTFVGLDAGYANTTGYQNTYLGYAAGNSATGSGNVFLGYTAGYSETGSNKLYIANTSTFTPLIYGEFDNKILTINGNLEVVAPDNGLIYLTNTTTNNTTKVSRMVLDHYSNAQLPVYLFGAASTAADNFVAFGGGNTIGNAATQIDLFTAPDTTTPVGYPRVTILGDGYVGIGTQTPSYPLQMASGARVTIGGAWTNASSRDYKENIEVLSTEEALEAIKELNPVKFAYKTDRTEKHVGFIAEEVPELIATKDRKGLSPMDIVAVLTKVVQEQQKMVKELKAENEGLKVKNESLENRLLVIEATIKASN